MDNFVSVISSIFSKFLETDPVYAIVFLSFLIVAFSLYVLLTIVKLIVGKGNS